MRFRKQLPVPPSGVGALALAAALYAYAIAVLHAVLDVSDHVLLHPTVV